jgi:hypothetical protein
MRWNGRLGEKWMFGIEWAVFKIQKGLFGKEGDVFGR